MKKPNIKKLLKRTGWTLACLLTLTVLVYAIENWRGARAWKEARKQMEAEGEVFDYQGLIPAPVPAADNFAATPLIESLIAFQVVPESEDWLKYDHPETRERFLRMQLPLEEGRPKLSDLSISRMIDLPAWAEYLDAVDGFDTGDATLPPAERILAGFHDYRPMLDELTEAARNRPHAQFPTEAGENYMDLISMPSPHIFEIMKISKFLSLRSSASIAVGDMETALDGIVIQLRLAEATGSQPMLISHLVELVQIRQVLNAIWEGLHHHAWSDEDLQEIERRLSALRIIDSGLQGMRGEMAFFAAGAEFFKSASFSEFSTLLGLTLRAEDGAVTLAYCVPDGWHDQNAVRGCRFLYDSCISPLKERRFSQLGHPKPDEFFGSRTPYTFMAQMMTPAMARAATRTAYYEVVIAQARIACSLERHFLATGSYPDTLQAIASTTPGTLPRDIMADGPMGYERVGTRYRLHSFSWDRKANEAVTIQSGERFNPATSDWVWSYPDERPAAD